ncbi:MAG: calcium-binding protein, partial [Roseitalea porphyridii]|uniref:calcium-binding protein n=1 Tax=Roseitalea porphyridii TaxID=1852022 RepID=UPI0032EDB485
TLDGGDNNDVMLGGNGNDWFDGGNGADVIDGGNGNDTAYGGAGADYMEGGNGNDWFDGGTGNDTLIGGNGNDTMNGGAGDDLFFGGNGKDIFVFTDLGGIDEVADFQKNQDKIDLSDLDAINGGAMDSFNWIGSASFSNTAGELRAYSAGGDNYLVGDTDGDGVADFTIVTNVLISQYDILFA